MPTYAVITGTKLVGTTSKLKLARRLATGVDGRRIIRHSSDGERIQLRDFRGGAFYIHGTEVL